MRSFLAPTVLLVSPLNSPVAGESSSCGLLFVRSLLNVLFVHSGGVFLTVTGSSFGVNASVLVGGKPCATLSSTHTRIECSAPSLFPSSSVAFSVKTTPVRTMAATAMRLTYDAPLISTVVYTRCVAWSSSLRLRSACCLLVFSAPCTGGSNATLSGSNFGSSFSAVRATLRMQANQAAAAKIVSVYPTSVVVRLPAGFGTATV